MRKIRSRARAIPGSQDWGKSTAGNPQVGVRVQTIGGDLDGQYFTWYGPFTPDAEARTLDQLRIAGWNGDWDHLLDLPGLGETEFELQLEDQTDRAGQLVINQDTGEPYLRPTFINRIGVAMKNVMDQQERAAFAAQLRARFGGGAPPRTRTPPRAAARNSGPDMTAPPPGDDDINF